MEIKVFIQKGCLPASSIEQLKSNPDVIVSIINCNGDSVPFSKGAENASYCKWKEGIYICKFDFFEELVNCPHIRWRIPVNNDVDVNLLLENFDKIVEHCLKVSRVENLINNNSICLEILRGQKKDLELTKHSLKSRKNSTENNEVIPQIASHNADIALVDEAIKAYEKEIYQLSLQKLSI